MIETVEFGKVEELFEFISPWGNETDINGYIFRGHGQEHYKLIPTALRLEYIDQFWHICGMGKPIEPQHLWQRWQISAEYHLLRSFYRLADQRGLDVPVSPRVRENLSQDFDFMGMTNNNYSEIWIPSDLLETAGLAQHYGIPTRLLDWTYDIYVALYFAFRGALNKNTKLCVWALNKEYLSFLKPTVNSVNVNFVTPHYAANPNISAQKGLFTHWPITVQPHTSELQAMMLGQVAALTDRRPLDELIISQIKHDTKAPNIFKKFILPCSEAAKGSRILDKLGYDSARIFPGYDGVAKQLLSMHQYK